IDRYGRIYISMQSAGGAVSHAWPLAVVYDGVDGGQWEFDVNNPTSGAGRFARAIARSGPDSMPRLAWIVPGFTGSVALKTLRCTAPPFGAATFADESSLSSPLDRRFVLLVWSEAMSNTEAIGRLIADAVSPATFPSGSDAVFDSTQACYRVAPRGGRAR